MKPKKAVVVIGITLGLFCLLSFAYVQYDLRPTEEVSPAPSAPAAIDPTILEAADKYGINRTILAEAAPTYGKPADVCRGDFTGCYANYKIIIEPGHLDVLPHEYMHHIWWKHMDEAERNRMAAVVDDFYQKNKPAMQARMAKYAHNPADFSNELHSVICTEVSDNKLPPELRQHCTKWLPNRGALPSYF